jgi:hypothetical protein
LGKAADEGRKEEKRSQMSKGDEVDQFLREKPVHHRLRRLVDRINLTGAGQTSLGGPESYLVVCAFVKAVCRKTARTV